ncbi:MAG TPA: hypothetical protein VIM53_04885 [Candidatus Saccharimonadales bacterium]
MTHELFPVDPEIPDPVVEKNLAMMAGPEMFHHISKVRRLSLPTEIDGRVAYCDEARGYVDRATGGITAFGRPQDVDVDERTKVRDEPFRFVVGYSQQTLEKIVTEYSLNEDAVSQEARSRFAESVRLFNKQAPERARREVQRAKRKYGGEATLRALGYTGL